MFWLKSHSHTNFLRSQIQLFLFAIDFCGLKIMWSLYLKANEETKYCLDR